MVVFTEPFDLVCTPEFVQAPLGVHIDTFLTHYLPESSGGGLDEVKMQELRDHWALFTSVMGRQATVLGAVGANAWGAFDNPADKVYSQPDHWFSGDLPGWQALGIPTDGSVTPLLTWTFSDGFSDHAFEKYAEAPTARFPDDATGRTYLFWIQNSVALWRDAGFTKLYIRINWEWQSSNATGGPLGGFGVETVDRLRLWRNAWRGFANAAKKVPGINVRMVWCPATVNTVGEPQVPPYNQPLMAYFPTVSGAEADGFTGGPPVGGQYIDVVGPDHYAFGGSTGLCYPEQEFPKHMSGTVDLDDVWYFRRCVEIAQQQGCTIAISELGDFHPDTMDAWVDWIPNHFTTYMNTLRTLTDGAVPIEYFALWDTPGDGGVIPFSNLAPINSDLMGWRKCLGAVGNNPPPYELTPIMTLPISIATLALFTPSVLPLSAPLPAGTVVGTLAIEPVGWTGIESVDPPFAMSGDNTIVVGPNPLLAGTYTVTGKVNP